MISVESRKVITSELSFCLTRAPMTPSDVSRRYSNGRVLDVVLRKGYKNNGMWAAAGFRRLAIDRARGAASHLVDPHH